MDNEACIQYILGLSYEIKKTNLTFNVKWVVWVVISKLNEWK